MSQFCRCCLLCLDSSSSSSFTHAFSSCLRVSLLPLLLFGFLTCPLLLLAFRTALLLAVPTSRSLPLSLLLQFECACSVCYALSCLQFQLALLSVARVLGLPAAVACLLSRLRHFLLFLLFFLRLSACSAGCCLLGFSPLPLLSQLFSS